ncbi:alpha-glucosidase [Nocardioides sp. BE266]|uniref:glycoside hydrolase family 13 protein n=1 Tax=Nocardioides sp. BE266 TaxID=2817725 RepID=UPI00285819AF|nr:glycoside hydrolase family 13 protein [Nocardioides sp. BE266]MDR7252558.1 alpha-glucosidase [Nocardioides sp. BE266]
MSLPDAPDPWWRTAVIYEIYPRSFADHDGDGEGDIAGITARLPYLADLGVDAVWIAPWYPSPMADGGYDVSDYCDIDPRFGTLDDADAMFAEAHRLGLRVIVDLVANHTSSQHPWFLAARAAEPGSPERARYHFREGTGLDGGEPPNNWISAFGGPAWTRIDDGRTPAQWYLHLFAPEQPDLNWEDATNRDTFDDVLRFWLDRGVDGFRIDAAPGMSKHPDYPDFAYPDPQKFATATWTDNPHWDVDTVHDIFRRWRRVVDAHPGEQVLVAEAVVNGPERLARYLGPDEIQTAFNFDYVHAPWDPAALREVIDRTMTALAPIGAPATWAMSSHDEVRHATRFGRAGETTWGGPSQTSDLELGRSRARAAIMLTLALPGGAYLYQGEELGLEEVEDLPDAVLQDPVFTRTGGRIRGRDGCRVPLPWSGTEAPFGFSPTGASAPWLPQPAHWRDLTVEAEQGDPDSMLSLYRTALAVRKETADLLGPSFEWLPSAGDVLRFRRGTRFECVVNLGPDDVPTTGPVVLSSDSAPSGNVGPDTAVWIVHDVPPEIP